MKDYTVGQTFTIKGKTYKVFYPANLNAQCDGCFFKNPFCEAPPNLICWKPSRIFKHVKVKNRPKRNTLWRNFKASILRADHFYKDPKNRSYLNLIQQHYQSQIL